MALEEAIAILEVLVPIAKAIPVLGAPVEGSLEALGMILQFVRVRHLVANIFDLSSILTLPQSVESNKAKTEELAVQVARWLNTVVDVLKELELGANHLELEGLRPNMDEILKCVTSHSIYGRDLIRYPMQSIERSCTVHGTLREARKNLTHDAQV
jgi:hypothetical protein